MEGESSSGQEDHPDNPKKVSIVGKVPVEYRHPKASEILMTPYANKRPLKKTQATHPTKFPIEGLGNQIEEITLLDGRM